VQEVGARLRYVPDDLRLLDVKAGGRQLAQDVIDRPVLHRWLDFHPLRSVPDEVRGRDQIEGQEQITRRAQPFAAQS
jgi:hypothetical protein